MDSIQQKENMEANLSREEMLARWKSQKYKFKNDAQSKAPPQLDTKLYKALVTPGRQSMQSQSNQKTVFNTPASKISASLTLTTESNPTHQFLTPQRPSASTKMLPQQPATIDSRSMKEKLEEYRRRRAELQKWTPAPSFTADRASLSKPRVVSQTPLKSTATYGTQNNSVSIKRQLETAKRLYDYAQYHSAKEMYASMIDGSNPNKSQGMEMIPQYWIDRALVEEALGDYEEVVKLYETALIRCSREEKGRELLKDGLRAFMNRLRRRQENRKKLQFTNKKAANPQSSSAQSSGESHAEVDNRTEMSQGEEVSPQENAQVDNSANTDDKPFTVPVDVAVKLVKNIAEDIFQMNPTDNKETVEKHCEIPEDTELIGYFKGTPVVTPKKRPAVVQEFDEAQTQQENAVATQHDQDTQPIQAVVEPAQKSLFSPVRRLTCKSMGSPLLKNRPLRIVRFEEKKEETAEIAEELQKENVSHQPEYDYNDVYDYEMAEEDEQIEIQPRKVHFDDVQQANEPITPKKTFVPLPKNFPTEIFSIKTTEHAEKEDSQKSGTAEGRITFLTPLQTTAREKMVLGTPVKLTQVKRSTRLAHDHTSQADKKIVPLLNEADFTYVPNESLKGHKVQFQRTTGIVAVKKEIENISAEHSVPQEETAEQDEQKDEESEQFDPIYSLSNQQFNSLWTTLEQLDKQFSNDAPKYGRFDTIEEIPTSAKSAQRFLPHNENTQNDADDLICLTPVRRSSRISHKSTESEKEKLEHTKEKVEKKKAKVLLVPNPTIKK